MGLLCAKKISVTCSSLIGLINAFAFLILDNVIQYVSHKRADI